MNKSDDINDIMNQFDPAEIDLDSISLISWNSGQQTKTLNL